MKITAENDRLHPNGVSWSSECLCPSIESYPSEFIVVIVSFEAGFLQNSFSVEGYNKGYRFKMLGSERQTERFGGPGHLSAFRLYLSRYGGVIEYFFWRPDSNRGATV